MSIQITKNNYDEIIKDSKLPVLIDFYADWCAPCKMAAPIVEQLAKENRNEAKICKINIDEEPELARIFNVSGIPTFIVIKDNKIINRVTGLRNRQELKNMLIGA